MGMFFLAEGAPDEPDTGDWDAICAAPSVEGFFGLLFQAIARRPLPELGKVRETEDDEAIVRSAFYGDEILGAEVTTVRILESTMFDLRCEWETYGLPGVKVKWTYLLAHAAPLGHVAYRHGRLECVFAGDAERDEFARVWQDVFGKVPMFVPT